MKRLRIRRSALAVGVPGGGYESEEAKDRAFDLAALAGANPANVEVYDPRETSRFAKPGAWGMIVRRLPPMERALDDVARVGRVFWLEHGSNADEAGFLPDHSYKVICRLPGDDAHLFPYEYSVIPPARLLELWLAEELLFHPLNLELARFNDVVFYARSRGVDLAEAAAMALGTLQGPVGWFEPRADLAPELEALSERINLWPWDATKRRQARLRKGSL